MSSAHAHSHGAAGRRLRLAFLLTAIILVVEIAGGVIANSLALLSDAGHVFTDVLALGLAWFATVQAGRPAHAGRTYGYHRIGILAALVNATTLILIVGFIAFEAVRRLQQPPHVTPWPMIIAAGAGLAVNLFIASGLRKEDGANLNVRAALVHVLGDIGASFGVIAAAVVILASHWYPIDPILSLTIAALIAKGAWDILRETVDILMEGAPRGLNVADMVRDMVHEPGVRDVHDLHVWSIAGGMSALSAHVRVDDRPLSQCDQVLASLGEMLQRRYRIAHATLQLESASCTSTHLYCGMNGNRRDDCTHGHQPDAVRRQVR